MFLSSFFQNDECNNNGWISVHNLHCSFNHANCSSRRHLSKISARCTTGIWGQPSLNCDKNGTNQSLFLQGDLFIVKLKKKVRFFIRTNPSTSPQRTNFKMSLIWYSLFAIFKSVSDSLCYFLNTRYNIIILCFSRRQRWRVILVFQSTSVKSWYFIIFSKMKNKKGRFERRGRLLINSCVSVSMSVCP